MGVEPLMNGISASYRRGLRELTHMFYHGGHRARARYRPSRGPSLKVSHGGGTFDLGLPSLQKCQQLMSVL